MNGLHKNTCKHYLYLFNFYLYFLDLKGLAILFSDSNKLTDDVFYEVFSKLQLREFIILRSLDEADRERVTGLDLPHVVFFSNI